MGICINTRAHQFKLDVYVRTVCAAFDVFAVLGIRLSECIERDRNISSALANMEIGNGVHKKYSILKWTKINLYVTD